MDATLADGYYPHVLPIARDMAFCRAPFMAHCVPT